MAKEKNTNGVIIYTDGSSMGNPGPGGYGIVMISPQHKLRKELSAGFRKTTNNRMELMAVCVALESLKLNNTPVALYSDSKYVVDAVEKGWLWGWQKKGFKDKKNPDLWQRFIRVYKKHKVQFFWVKGHAGNPENERCDQLAVEAGQQHDLAIDVGYEQE